MNSPTFCYLAASVKFSIIHTYQPPRTLRLISSAISAFPNLSLRAITHIVAKSLTFSLFNLFTGS